MNSPSTVRSGLLRSVPWWLWGVLIAALLLGYVIARAEPPAPLPPVDYFAVANKARGPESPPAENFFAGLLQLLPLDTGDVGPKLRASLTEALHVPPPPKGSPLFDLNLPKDKGDRTSNEFIVRFEHFQNVLWSADDDPVLAAWLAKNDVALDAMQAVARRPGSWRPLTKDGDFLIECLLGDLQTLRSIARLYRLRIGLKLKTNDVQGAERDLMTIYHMARHAGQGTTLIELLIGYALESIGHQSAALWMMHSDVTNEQRMAFLTEFRALKPMRTVAESIDQCERDMGLQIMAAFATSGPLRERAIKNIGLMGFSDDTPNQLPTALAKAGFPGLFAFDGETARDIVDRRYDELVAIARISSTPERKKSEDSFHEKLKKIREQIHPNDPSQIGTYIFQTYEFRAHKIADLTTLLLMPALSQCSTAQDRNTAGGGILATAIAATNYRAEHGRWPASIADLPPEIAALKDPFHGGPYLLRVKGDDLEVYTLGPDGKDHNDPPPPHDRQSRDDGTLTLRATPQPALPVPNPDGD